MEVTDPRQISLPVREYERSQQCPTRRACGNVGSCGLVDVSLGWRHGMHMDSCDQCYAMRPNSRKAAKWRRWYADEVLKGLGINQEVFKKAVEGWKDVREKWRRADSFVRAMASRGLTGKKADEITIELRQLACFGNEEVEPCSMLRKSTKGEYRYCSACGCGDKRIARLDGEGYTKLMYPELKCPLGRF